MPWGVTLYLPKHLSIIAFLTWPGDVLRDGNFMLVGGGHISITFCKTESLIAITRFPNPSGEMKDINLFTSMYRIPGFNVIAYMQQSLPAYRTTESGDIDVAITGRTSEVISV